VVAEPATNSERATITLHRADMTKQQRYLSYLLRIWQTSDGKKTIWRASLQSPGSQELHGFASLEELVDFLNAQTRQAEDETRISHQ
jgi:hypothetical protein